MAEEKTKILCLMELLLKETDAEHALNATEIISLMEDQYGYSYDRRTIYTDMKRLEKAGMKIGQKKGASFGYYVAERSFELPELKLLVDAVQSSKFITKERSEILIRKLAGLVSKHSASELQRNVFIVNRSKAENDAVYSNVDAIHAAMRDNLQICFKYCEWDINKELVRRKNGSDYIVSPWALTWDSENYYLVAYTADEIRHYRVDKMQEVSATNEERAGREAFQNFDLAAYMIKTFGMYNGHEEKITLEGSRRLVGVVIDRFGTDVMLIPYGEDKFHAIVTVAVSPQFFGWLTGLGGSITISSPSDVREEYLAFMRKTLGAY